MVANTIKEHRWFFNCKSTSEGRHRFHNHARSLGYISDYLMVLGGGVGVYLTTDGLEYFDEKRDLKSVAEDRSITFHINGGQVNLASGNAAITATQNNGVYSNELDCIIRGIMENLSDLKRENAEEIMDVVNMAREELEKQEPKASRLRNCITLIAPMLTITNGIPALAGNLQKLIGYIRTFIQ